MGLKARNETIEGRNAIKKFTNTEENLSRGAHFYSTVFQTLLVKNN